MYVVGWGPFASVQLPMWSEGSFSHSLAFTFFGLLLGYTHQCSGLTPDCAQDSHLEVLG